MGQTDLLPFLRKTCWGFFALKNPKASAGFEPANLGTKGQHASSRPPKPLNSGVRFGVGWKSEKNRLSLKFLVARQRRNATHMCPLADGGPGDRAGWTRCHVNPHSTHQKSIQFYTSQHSTAHTKTYKGSLKMVPREFIRVVDMGVTIRWLLRKGWRQVRGCMRDSAWVNPRRKCSDAWHRGHGRAYACVSSIKVHVRTHRTRNKQVRDLH